MDVSQTPDFELVLAVLDYWDQPRAGIALVQGIPHRFFCPFDEQADDYTDWYHLHAIDTAMLRLECEACEIYFGHSPSPEMTQVLPDPIPRLPEAEARFNELQLALKEDRHLVENSNQLAMAEFKRRVAPDTWRGGQLWSVRWMPLGTPTR